MPQDTTITELMQKYIPNITPTQTQQFVEYMDLLIEHNKMYNLTAITDPEDVIIKHFADSLLGLDLIPDNASVIDVGSGAGFPAIPLKIMQDGLDVTMLDGTQKKVTFLTTVINQLGLTNIKALKLRAEVASESGNYRERYDVAVARALSNLNMLIELTVPLIKVGGLLIAYKGADAPNELILAKGAIHKLGLTLINQKEVALADKYTRILLVFKKTAPTNSKYPRLYSTIKSNPL